MKYGDKVKCVNNYESGLKLCMVYTIRHIDDKYIYLEEYGGPLDGFFKHRFVIHKYRTEKLKRIMR